MVMQKYSSRRLAAGLGVLLVVVVSWVFFYHECAAGGAMGGWYKECSCRGFERVDFDHTASDGPLRTVCFGLVATRTCYLDRGGQEIPCADITR